VTAADQKAFYLSVQNALNAAGAKPALVADGLWGEKSKTALRAFQKAKGLLVDALPGPKTLAALGLPAPAPGAPGSPSAQPAPKGNSSDANAYAVAKRAIPAMPEAQRQYVLAVSRGEGGYGAGWANPPKDPTALAFAKSKGLTGTEGAGSNNWGAEQGTGDAGSFPHVDFGWRNPDGTPWNGKGPKVWLPYIGNYKKHSTPEEGFKSVAATILNGGKRGTVGAKEIQDAIAKGDLKAAVYAQHANGYFELDPAEYLAAVTRNYAALADATGWLSSFGGAVAAGGGLVVGLALVTAALGGVWWFFKHRGGA
jgi:peptidoglycan hydrolase-like protein with peptidoglycan-binding domain